MTVMAKVGHIVPSKMSLSLFFGGGGKLYFDTRILVKTSCSKISGTGKGEGHNTLLPLRNLVYEALYKSTF